MDFSFFENILEYISSIGKFLFESYIGISILIASFIIITFFIAFILEFKTRKQFIDHHIEEEIEEFTTSDISISTDSKD